MAAKSLFAILSGAGYCIIKRLADGYYMNDADGSFAASPADPYLALAEDSVAKGLYSASESRIAWNDGTYRVTYYLQSGGSPNPTADAPPVKIDDITVSGDQVVTTEFSNSMDIFIRAKMMTLTSASRVSREDQTETARQLRENNAFASNIDKAQRRI